MRRVYYQTNSGDDLQAKLQASLCPTDADVRLDQETGIVSITTSGVWRADRNGFECGLGVEGWSLLGTETVGEIPEGDDPVLKDAKYRMRADELRGVYQEHQKLEGRYVKIKFLLIGLSLLCLTQFFYGWIY